MMASSESEIGHLEFLDIVSCLLLTAFNDRLGFDHAIVYFLW